VKLSPCLSAQRPSGAEAPFESGLAATAESSRPDFSESTLEAVQ